MLNNISHNVQSFEFLLRNVERILPGISFVKAIYFDEKEFKIRSLVKNSTEIYFDDITPTQLPIIQKQRGNAQKYEWFKNDFELLNNDDLKEEQLSLHDEIQQNVLCLRFHNPIDRLYDVLLIYFDNKIGTLKLTSDNSSLKSGDKNIIERLLFNNISFFLDNERQNALLFKNVIEKLNHLKTQLFELEKEKNAHANSYKESIHYYCKTFVYNFSKAQNLSINISNSAIDKLIKHQIPFGAYDKILSDSIILLINTNYGNDGEILIDEHDVIIPDKPFVQNINQLRKFEPEKQMTDRYTKTKEYLDRYEKAAETILENKLSLTGYNIGNCCSPIISAAAISDNIKKHRQKIITLLNRYPDHWPIIREHFKPIQKLIANTGQWKNAV